MNKAHTTHIDIYSFTTSIIRTTCYWPSCGIWGDDSFIDGLVHSIVGFFLGAQLWCFGLLPSLPFPQLSLLSPSFFLTALSFFLFSWASISYTFCSSNRKLSSLVRCWAQVGGHSVTAEFNVKQTRRSNNDDDVGYGKTDTGSLAYTALLGDNFTWF